MTQQRRGQARTRARSDEKRRPNDKSSEPRGPLARLRQLVGRLRVVRKGLDLQWSLAPKPGEAATTIIDSRPAKSATAPTDPVARELHQIGRLLRYRLDRHALARKVFPQLGIVERELGRHGYPVLRSLPVELLHGALEQLSCIAGSSPGELATLRSKMLEAILARQPKAGDFGGNLALSVFDAPHKLEIREAGESAFFHAQQEWTQKHARASAR
jgi:hypothetical protein